MLPLLPAPLWALQLEITLASVRAHNRCCCYRKCVAAQLLALDSSGRQRDEQCCESPVPLTVSRAKNSITIYASKLPPPTPVCANDVAGHLKDNSQKETISISILLLK